MSAADAERLFEWSPDGSDAPCTPPPIIAPPPPRQAQQEQRQEEEEKRRQQAQQQEKEPQQLWRESQERGRAEAEKR